MEKFRRNRRNSSPTTTKSQPATSSNEAAVAASSSSSLSTSAATKFTIQQKIPTGTAPKKGPYSVKRTIDPNEVVIKRRIGEGAKPLFSRDGVCINRSASPKNKRAVSSSSSSSDSTSSAEGRSRPDKETPKSQPIKRKSPEKIPYFLDEKRENDRIRRVYGSRRSRSLSRDRRRPRNRSRTRSPPSYSRRYRSSYNDRRPSSREGYRSRHHRSDYSRSRSRSRERRRRNAYRYRDELDEGRPSAVPPATQFIPIPVPVMSPAWGPPMMPPQPRFPFMMRPPIPGPVPFMPRQFRPPRYFMPNGHQRLNFRPRH